MFLKKDSYLINYALLTNNNLNEKEVHIYI